MKYIKIICLLSIICMLSSSCASKETKEVSHKDKINLLLEINFIEDDDVLSFKETHDNFFAIELKLSNKKLEELLSSRPHLNYDDSTREDVVQEGVSSKNFSKDLSLCDEEYTDINRIKYATVRKGLTKVTYSTNIYSHFYVFKTDEDNNFICIKLFGDSFRHSTLFN